MIEPATSPVKMSYSNIRRLARLFERLEELTGREPVQAGSDSGPGWLGLCPVSTHDDERRPLLRIAITTDDNFILQCSGGCHPSTVADEVGLGLDPRVERGNLS